MGQRAYCGQDHPGGDAEADRWCEMYHRPIMPRPLPRRCEMGRYVDGEQVRCEVTATHYGGYRGGGGWAGAVCAEHVDGLAWVEELPVTV